MRVNQNFTHCFSLLFISNYILLVLVKTISCNTKNIPENSTYSLRPYKSSELIEWIPAGVPNPEEWPGEHGVPYLVPEDQETYNKYFKINQFNILASDRIAFNRTLKDSRMTKCKSKQYRKSLPTTSVIIVFHNEAWSTLLRTVNSVIKTSSTVLKEVILVDDASTKVYLRKQLEDYVKNFKTPVKVLRLRKRSGLIQARLLGAANSKGQVLTFLDAHCECNEGWLEPLLDRIAEDRTRVVCPIIDVINEENFKYEIASDLTWGGFDWKIGFRWYNSPKRELDRRNGDRTLPLRTPTMSGGLFSIDRDFFNLIGKYDEGMTIWGAENLEFSFRIWMCGGSIELVTCARVGHIFRKETPYTLPGGKDYIVWHNTARLASVWLDEWTDFYFTLTPKAQLINHGNITDRISLRNKLGCKSFRWYLENIYPESQLPREYYFLGDIKSLATGQCLDTLHSSGGDIVLNPCLRKPNQKMKSYNQLFLYTTQQRIVNNEKCLEGEDLDEFVTLKRCHSEKQNQIWKYNVKSKTLVHFSTNLCLESIDNKELILNICNGDSTQTWLFRNNFQWQLLTHL